VTDPFAGVVIVAAGRGERFGDSSKVLAEAGGRPLLTWSLEAAASAVSTAEIVVVCGTHTSESILPLVRECAGSLRPQLCQGGATRQDSVRAGLDMLSESVEVAVIHDAARPLATSFMFDDVACAARRWGAAIVAVPVTDTIKEVDGGCILRSLPRDALRAAQTPQAFHRGMLMDAMNRAEVAGEVFTDEAGLLEWAGVPVWVRPGSAENLKVTLPGDLLLADVLLRARVPGGADVST
jgi:2-C-methyl-D-erythritol 4-phosphate cytidylyltransferase